MSLTAVAKPLGLWGATALVIGNMIGSGTYLLPAALAPYGGATLIGWAITLTGALLLAGVFAALAREAPRAGGPYAYARARFGDTAGFLTGWLYWLSIVSGNAAIAVAFAGSFGALVPAAAATPIRAALCAVAALWFCTVFNLAGLRTANVVQSTTVVLKVLPLVAIATVGLFAVPGDVTLPAPQVSGGVISLAAATAALTLWAFLGLECATVPADAVRDAARTVPRATWLGTVVAGIVTIAACTVVVVLLPADVLARSGAPFSDAARALWGDGAGRLYAVAGAIACFGTLNGWVLMQGQLPAAIARDGLFPPVFARENAAGVPSGALLVGTAIATALILARSHGSLVGLFTASVLISTAATLVPYVACALAALVAARSARTAGLTVVAALALAYSVWALAGTGTEALAWCAASTVVGLVFHATRTRRRV